MKSNFKVDRLSKPVWSPFPRPCRSGLLSLNLRAQGLVEYMHIRNETSAIMKMNMGGHILKNDDIYGTFV